MKRHYFSMTVAVIMSVAAASGTAAPTQIIAYDGGPVPGMPNWVMVFYSNTSRSPPTINATGEVAFHTNIEDPNLQPGRIEGIWSTAGGALAPVVLATDPVPGGGTYRWLGLRILIDDGGQVAFGASIQEDDSDIVLGIFADGSGSLRNVVREGHTIPQVDPVSPVFGYQFSDIGYWANFMEPYSSYDYLFDGGHVAFAASAGPAPDDQANIGYVTGIWSQALDVLPSELRLIARTGADTDFGDIDVDRDPAAVNGHGWAIFEASVSIADPDRPPGSDDRVRVQSIWSQSGGMFAQVAFALGRDPGDFSSFGVPAINDNGDAAFEAGIVAPEGGQSSGIFKQFGGGSPGTIAIEGTVAAGTTDFNSDGTPDFLFTDFQNPLISDSGSVAFEANVTTPDQSQSAVGIWTDRSGALLQLELIALTGAQAPGLPEGTVFFKLGGTVDSSDSDLVINAFGDIAFYAEFEAPDGTRGFGIWAEHQGTLKLIAKAVPNYLPGDMVQRDAILLPDGSSIELTGLDFAGGSGNSDGRMSGFSDNGEVVFRAIGGRDAIVSVNVATLGLIFTDGFDPLP